MVEELFAQDFAHVDGRRRKKHSTPTPLVPVNVRLFFALHKECQFPAHFGRASRHRDHFLGLRRERREFGLDSLHGRGQLVVRLAILIEEGVPFSGPKRIAPFAFRKALEQAAGALAQPC